MLVIAGVQLKQTSYLEAVEKSRLCLEHFEKGNFHQVVYFNKALKLHFEILFESQNPAQLKESVAAYEKRKDLPPGAREIILEYRQKTKTRRKKDAQWVKFGFLSDKKTGSPAALAAGAAGEPRGQKSSAEDNPMSRETAAARGPMMR